MLLTCTWLRCELGHRTPQLGLSAPNSPKTSPFNFRLRLVVLSSCGNLLLCAKRLLVAARERCGLGCCRYTHDARCSRHPNRGIDGVLEIVGVVGRGLVAIAKLHAIVPGAYFAQSEPEMAHDRFGFLQRHSSSSTRRTRGPGSYGLVWLLLSRLGPCVGLVPLGQTFVRSSRDSDCPCRRMCNEPSST
jgi:hypothetical protein